MPILGTISAISPMDVNNILNPKPIGIATMPASTSSLLVSKVYAVKIADDSMEPALQKDTILFVKKGSWEDLKSGNFCIYTDENNKLHVKKLILHSNQLQLQSLNNNFKDILLPNTYIKTLDKVIHCEFP